MSYDVHPPRILPGGEDLPDPMRRNVNREMETAAVRKDQVHTPDEGCLAIAVSTGERLGELYVNVQFEGRWLNTDQGQYDECQRGQNRALLHTAEWLREILDKLTGEIPWTVQLTAQPCPKSKVVVAANAANNVLRGAGVQQEIASLSRTGQVAVDNSVQAKHQAKPDVGPQLR